MASTPSIATAKTPVAVLKGGLVDVKKTPEHLTEMYAVFPVLYSTTTSVLSLIKKQCLFELCQFSSAPPSYRDQANDLDLRNG
jgi:hypothetical protein